MKKMNLIRTLFLAVFFAGSGFAESPNILLILADDLGYHDLSCQGATDFETPNLDRLAASGVRFSAGYVSAPQCGPSRSGLMTGMSQSRYGCLDNSSRVGLPPSDTVQTLPEQLKARGYTTGIIGKWHIGCDNKTDGHPIFPGNNPWERGFDYVLTHDSGHSHYYPYREDGMKWMTERHLEYRLERKMEDESTAAFVDDLPADTYLTDYFSEQGVDFIKRNQDHPWFLYLSYNAPHTPSVAKADKLAKYEHIEDHMRRHLVAMMDSLDEGIGQVLGTLEETGQDRETLVFFLSDNGGPTHRNGSRNDPFSGRKGDVHEGGIRVPFLAAWPGTIGAGQVLDGPVISLDILPTALAAAGADGVPEIHEGKNLLPWLKGEASCPNDVICWNWRSKAAVRIGSLKETRNGNDVEAIDGTVVPGHIFADLDENPKELEAKALQSPEKQKMLADRLDQWLRQLEEDQKKLMPLATPDSVKQADAEEPKAESAPQARIVKGVGGWNTRGAPENIRFENGTLTLAGSASGQPVAGYLPIDNVHLNDGQTLQVQSMVATTRADSRAGDVRMCIGYSSEAIGNSSQLAIPMKGVHFAAPSGGRQSGIVATQVQADGGSVNFFNAPRVSKKSGALKLSASVSSDFQPWSIRLTRKGDRLLFSSTLGSARSVELSELGSGLAEEDFVFNTVGFAYLFSQGERLSVKEVQVSLIP